MDKKKILVSSIFILLLIALVVGITYAVFNYVNNASENTIQTGSITMSYSEPSNALELINALPMSDEEGEEQTNYFEFNVSSNASTNANDDTGVTIPYEINISDLEVNEGMLELPKNAIKISLVKVEDGTEVQVMEPTLLSNMSASSLRENATKIYNTENVHKNGNGAITTTYRLRAWIDKDYSINKDTQEQYKFSVNVNSAVSPLSLLKLNKIMLEKWESNTTAMNNTNDDVLRLASENGTWREVTSDETLTKDDKIRITFIYNSNIKGVAPTLTLKFGENDATGSISNGEITENKLSYEYTITKEDEGKIAIKDLTGGSIKDNSGSSAPAITSEEKDSLKVIAIKPILTLNEEILGKNNSKVVTSGDGLYSTTETNSGNPSYYYRGNVTNNYVKLDEDKDGVADTLYRIIRINEDGSVRLIRQNNIGTNSFYPNLGIGSYNYKYMYYSESNVEGGIMKSLEVWYATTFTNTELDNKIVKSIFCEQAKIKKFSSYESGNAVMVVTSDDYKPTYKCEIDGNGKGILNKKVGLISADEANYAGVPLAYANFNSNNRNSYLIRPGNTIWTMSPSYGSSDGARVWAIIFEGRIDDEFNSISKYSNSVFPVINLSADISVLGEGTEISPFELVY